MGQVQEQRYVCKICSKICVSGKSLGGHMRVHSALISKEKSESEIQFEEGNDDQESCIKNQSNSDEEEEEEIGDEDQSSSYGLRENPKKSWRISDPQNGTVSKIKASCKECSKDFPSLRALSGHMRSHSIKNKKVHKCTKCGKAFNSVRAMYGHMKSHSTKSKPHDDGNGNEESLSLGLDGLCPVRGKRSRIRYSNAPNLSISGFNASASAGSSFEDVEEVAKCLMMLSRGECEEFSDDDGSEYYGANSSYKGNEGSDHKMSKVFARKRGRNCDEALLDSCNDSKRKRFSAARYDPKLDLTGNLVEQEKAGTSKSKEHECPVCFKLFTSGQALGGHKRAHYNGLNESKMNKESEVSADVCNLLDLNHPAMAAEEGANVKREAGLNGLWWANGKREAAVVLTT
ncbi:zinc finger protein ZAT4 isoform X2 [Andrographis paniculata]|uniref:zinc finger protein ZAT4 isoform X2 n=1 Tax=Andrographis paniculata TaxID=175694 RepID=UPI0021E8399E|nr:zinc finger protein ZAT4 isoform X2 [Andrographis paniculata]